MRAHGGPAHTVEPGDRGGRGSLMGLTGATRGTHLPPRDSVLAAGDKTMGAWALGSFWNLLKNKRGAL